MTATEVEPLGPLRRASLPPPRSNNVLIPPAKIIAGTSSSRSKRMTLDDFAPVNQNGSYEFDRVIKSGYVQKRTQKTKTWKSVFLVMRPNTLSIYKSDKEDKLRYKLYLSDLTAITSLKDPKQKRLNVFGLFSPSKNFHFQAPTAEDAEEWVELVRRDARIEEEEEEMFMASPAVCRQSCAPTGPGTVPRSMGDRPIDMIVSSSPEAGPNMPSRRPTMIAEYSGFSGNDLASHSDFSDVECQRVPGASIESLTLQQSNRRPDMGPKNTSQTSGFNMDRDPDRVIWQGWLWFLRSKRGVKQWKNMWAVLRPRNLILYKDEYEYTAQFIVPLSSVLNVVDIDPVSKTKAHCLQVITDEKSYKFCAHDEEPLVQCLGAFKSLLAKRKELEARAVSKEHAIGIPGPSSP